MRNAKGEQETQNEKCERRTENAYEKCERQTGNGKRETQNMKYEKENADVLPGHSNFSMTPLTSTNAHIYF